VTQAVSHRSGTGHPGTKYENAEAPAPLDPVARRARRDLGARKLEGHHIQAAGVGLRGPSCQLGPAFVFNPHWQTLPFMRPPAQVPQGACEGVRRASSREPQLLLKAQSTSLRCIISKALSY
jgi:hypothetical protein